MNEMKHGLKNQSGFTLIETVIGISIALALTGAAGVMIVNVFSESGVLNSQAASGISEMEAVQALHSPRTLRKLVELSDRPGLEECLSESGSNCNGFQSTDFAPANMKAAQMEKYIGGGGDCTELSQNCPFDREVLYRWKCSEDNRCEGVEVVVRISHYQFEYDDISQLKKAKLRKTRESKYFVNAFDIAMAPAVNYENCDGKMIVGIDHKNKKAICQERTDQIYCDGFSVIGIGGSNCGKAPPASSTSFCSLQLNKTSSGLTMKYSASSGDATRIAYRCTRKGSTTGNVQNIVYFGPKSGTQNIPVNSGSVTVKCEADLRGEGKIPLANCSASYAYTEPPPSYGDGSASGSGSGAGGPAPQSGNSIKKGTTKKTQTALTSNVKGSGSGFSGSIKTVQK